MHTIKVNIENRQKTVKVPTGMRLLIRRCCHAVLTLENFEGAAEVDVMLVDNAQIRAISSVRAKNLSNSFSPFYIITDSVI